MVESAPALSLEHASYAVGTATLLNDVSLNVGADAALAILGVNGAGKTTLIRLMHGLIAPTQGKVVWANGLNDAAKRHHALVFQRPVMLRRSAVENIAYGLQVLGVSVEEAEQRAEQALSDVGLAAHARQPARTLSGGEQQRLAIARAWARRPKVLFLDEPTASLDPTSKAMVESLIRRIHESGTAIVMSTHNLGQAKRLSSQVAFLHEGRLAELAATEGFFRAPQSKAADAFLKHELP